LLSVRKLVGRGRTRVELNVSSCGYAKLPPLITPLPLDWGSGLVVVVSCGAVGRAKVSVAGAGVCMTSPWHGDLRVAMRAN
jgi:hypothetical protein